MNMSQGFSQGGNFQGCEQQQHKESCNFTNKLSREASSLYWSMLKISVTVILVLKIIGIKKVY